MKNISFYLLPFSFLLFLIYSCNKETIVDTPTQVGISKVAYYPSISINGPKFIAVTEGAGYTDPGATAILNGDTINLYYEHDDRCIDNIWCIYYKLYCHQSGWFQ